ATGRRTTGRRWRTSAGCRGRRPGPQRPRLRPHPAGGPHHRRPRRLRADPGSAPERGRAVPPARSGPPPRLRVSRPPTEQQGATSTPWAAGHTPPTRGDREPSYLESIPEPTKGTKNMKNEPTKSRPTRAEPSKNVTVEHIDQLAQVINNQHASGAV